MSNDAFINIIQKKTGREFTVVVDAADYPKVKDYRWFIANCGGHHGMEKFYARRSGKKKGEVIYMHRQLAQPGPGEVVDHKDGNGLNNRRRNFIVTTQQHNARRQNKKRRTEYAAD